MVESALNFDSKYSPVLGAPLEPRNTVVTSPGFAQSLWCVRVQVQPKDFCVEKHAGMCVSLLVRQVTKSDGANGSQAVQM